MKYLGIDIAKYRHALAGIDAANQALFKPCFFTQDAEGFAQLEALLTESGSPEDILIGMEATGHYWVVLHDWLIQKGWTVHVMNPILSHAAASGSIRGRKSDKDDAQCIAKVVRDGGFTPYQVESENHQALKQLCRQRGYLSNELADGKRRLGALVDQIFPEWRTVWVSGIAHGLMAVLEEWPSAKKISKAHATRLGNVIRTASRKRASQARIRAIRDAAGSSVASSENPGLETAMRSMITHLRNLDSALKEMDREIQKYTNEEVERNRTAPGVGPVNAAVISAELGDWSHFEKKGKKMNKLVLAFMGMDPRIRESGTWKGKSKMSKRGSRSLRTAVYQSANVARTCSPGFKAIYDKQKDRGKSHQVAVSHVARKLVDVLVAMHKSNQPYSEEYFAKTTA